MGERNNKAGFLAGLRDKIKGPTGEGGVDRSEQKKDAVVESLRRELTTSMSGEFEFDNRGGALKEDLDSARQSMRGLCNQLMAEFTMSLDQIIDEVVDASFSRRDDAKAELRRMAAE